MTTISALVLISFLVYSYWKFKMTRSISAIYYELKEENRWMYTGAMIGLAIPLIIGITSYTANNLTPDSIWAVMFLSVGGIFIVFTGLAADSRSDRNVEMLHIIGATGGMLFGGIGLLFLPVWYWVLPQLILSMLFYFNIVKIKNKTYWIEVVNFVCITGAMYNL
jgi:hypothetical protein